MKIGIMQPYIFPYIGYFQLISAVDIFVIYDNIQYTKKGWINRNRLLQNGKDVLFSLPIKKGSDFLDVRDRKLADDYSPYQLINKISEQYRKAPFYNEIMPIIENILDSNERNLFLYIFRSVRMVCDYIGIKTNIIVSSAIEIDHSLKGQDKVLALCNKIGADTYINAIGGVDLYFKDAFLERGVSLNFLKSKKIEYEQFDNSFIPWLSIIDVLMFNNIDVVKKMIGTSYELV